MPSLERDRCPDSESVNGHDTVSGTGEYIVRVPADSMRKKHRWSPAGRFRYLSRIDRWEWSDEVAKMHGYQPGSVTPTTALLLSHKHPDDMPSVLDLIKEVRRHGTAFSSRHRIIDTSGCVHVVVMVGDRIVDKDGVPAGIAGFYVDETQQYQADVQARTTEAVQEITARKAVINQALGIMMGRYGVGADIAFQLLTRISQDSNTKLRVVAERLVAETSGGTPPADFE